MEDSLKFLSSLLTQTLSQDKAARETAESELKKHKASPGFSTLLLRLASMDTVDQGIRVAASIYLKNLVKFNWEPSEEKDEVKLSDSDKEEIRKVLFNVMLTTPPSIRKVLSEALQLIAEHDFPTRWPTLLPEVISKLQNPDFNIISGALHTAHAIFRRYRHQFTTDTLLGEIKHVLEAFQAPMLQVFTGVMQAIEANKANKAALGALFHALNLLLKIFFSLNWQDLPEYFEDHAQEYMAFFHTILTMENPLLDSGDDNVRGPLDKAQALVCQSINLYVEKYETEFQSFLPTFVTDVWQLLMKTGQAPKNDALIASAVRFLTTVSKSVHHKLFESSDTQRAICERVIIPNIQISEEEEELFEDNAAEFIRRDMEGADSDSRRRTSCELVKGLMKYYEAQITQIFTAFVTSMLQQYAANPSANWKAKDSAIYLITALSIKGQTQASGATSTNVLVNVIDFYTAHVLPELAASADVNASPVLKADALKFTITFRNQLPKEAYVTLLPLVGRFLGSKHTVVHSYAAICIERMLSVKDKAADGKMIPRLVKADVQPFLSALIPALFNIFNMPSSAENEHAMKCLMRVTAMAQEATAPLVGDMLRALTSIVGLVSKNPSRPTFNHFLFETVAALVKNNAASADLLEASLFPAFQGILSADVQEFTPYVFQILSELVELRSSPLPPAYMAIFPSLMVPTMWERPGNVPALVRLVQAYLRKAKAEVMSSGQLSAVLGVFQKLVSSRAHDHEGFYILNAIIDNLQLPEFEPFLPTILNILFTRLQSGKTAKFIRSLIEFFSIFAIKHSAAALISKVDTIQPGLFLMLLTSVWIGEMPKALGPIERKTSNIALTNILFETQPAVASQWAQILSALVQAIETDGGASTPIVDGEDETDAFEKAEQGEGYSAAFSQLVFSGSQHQQHGVATSFFNGLPNPRQHLASLVSRSASQPAFAGMLATVPPQIKQKIAEYGAASGIPLAL